MLRPRSNMLFLLCAVMLLGARGCQVVPVEPGCSAASPSVVAGSEDSLMLQLGMTKKSALSGNQTKGGHRYWYDSEPTWAKEVQEKEEKEEKEKKEKEEKEKKEKEKEGILGELELTQISTSDLENKDFWDANDVYVSVYLSSEGEGKAKSTDIRHDC